MLTARILALLPWSWHRWLIGPWGPLCDWWNRIRLTHDQQLAMPLPWREFIWYWWFGTFWTPGLPWSEDVKGFEYREIIR